MAVKVSGIVSTTKTLAQSSNITSDLIANESVAENTTVSYNGNTVYIKDYCPLCHNIVTVIDPSGNILKTNFVGTVNTSTGGTAVPATNTNTSTNTNTNNTNTNTNTNVGKVYEQTNTNTTDTSDDSIQSDEGLYDLDELVEKLNQVISDYMKISIYDVNKDGSVGLADRAKFAESVNWDDIIDKPSFNISAIESAVTSSHTHNNKTALDYITIDNTNITPLWNGSTWPQVWTAPQNNISQKFVRNIYINSGRPSNANIGDIWLEINNSDQIVGIHSKKNNSVWYFLTVSNLVTQITNKVIESVIDGNFLRHESMKDLLGGDEEGHYHLTSEQIEKLNAIQNNIDNNNYATIGSLESSIKPNEEATSIADSRKIIARIAALENRLLYDRT